MISNVISIIIPYYRGRDHIESILSSIPSMCDVYIIDSDSRDGVQSLKGTHQFIYIKISQKDFNHGRTRTEGARIATDAGAEILIFMTQDAFPIQKGWLDALVAPIQSGEAVATFARQLPRPHASLLEQFSRYFNYPGNSQSRTAADISKLGVKAFFFSNVCSAVKADVFWAVGGFPEDVIMNEDMTLAARLLQAGHTIRYVAEAEVVHSHDYTLQQQFRRNFDVGAFFADAGPELAGASVGGEGLRFVREQLKYVLRHGRPDLLPLVIVEAATKFMAFQLGKRHRLLPKSVKKYLSMHSYHWDQQKENV